MSDDQSHCATVSISNLSPTKDEQSCAFSTYKPPTANTFGNTYHPDMRYHPNFSWRQNQPQMQNSMRLVSTSTVQILTNYAKMKTKTHHHTRFQIKVSLQFNKSFSSYNQISPQLTQFAPPFNQFQNSQINSLL